MYVTPHTATTVFLSVALCDNGIHFSRAASHHRDAEFSAGAFRDLSRAYEKRTRAVMEKYTAGTQPLRRQPGCKEEENPYSATCADSFTDATFRRVVYQERRSRRALSRIASEQIIQPDARHSSSAVVADLSFMTSTVYRAGLLFRRRGESTPRVRDDFPSPFSDVHNLPSVFPMLADVSLILVDTNSI